MPSRPKECCLVEETTGSILCVLIYSCELAQTWLLPNLALSLDVDVYIQLFSGPIWYPHTSLIQYVLNSLYFPEYQAPLSIFLIYFS